MSLVEMRGLKVFGFVGTSLISLALVLSGILYYIVDDEESIMLIERVGK